MRSHTAVSAWLWSVGKKKRIKREPITAVLRAGYRTMTIMIRGHSEGSSTG